jgi:hypothetical protein
VAEFLLEIIKLVFGAIVEIIFVATGEVVLFIVTFGRRKPRWDLYTKENFGKFVLFSEISAWVGVVFWVVVIAVIANWR